MGTSHDDEAGRSNDRADLAGNNPDATVVVRATNRATICRPISRERRRETDARARARTWIRHRRSTRGCAVRRAVRGRRLHRAVASRGLTDASTPPRLRASLFLASSNRTHQHPISGGARTTTNEDAIPDFFRDGPPSVTPPSIYVLTRYVPLNRNPPRLRNPLHSPVTRQTNPRHATRHSLIFR